MTGPLAVPTTNERGFILVGVVMFMIALTILGLSLFALSSYEAQFFYASASREQSLQSSESGLELVKAELTAPNARLDWAQRAVGQFGVTKALAYQRKSSNPGDTTSSGLINRDSTLVVVVSARVGGEERTVQSEFLPTTTKNPYQQLISCGGSVWYNPAQDFGTMQLRGGVWQHVQSAADSTWTNHVAWPIGRPIDVTRPPIPSASSYVNAKRPGASAVDAYLFDKDNQPYWIDFNNTSRAPKYYKSPPPAQLDQGKWGPLQSQYEFFSEHNLDIRVHGTVVWVVNQGACFHGTVTVKSWGPIDPTDPNVLVIVAKPSVLDPADPNRGIWFQAGLVNDSTTTKVFLVSDGDISLTQDLNEFATLQAHAISLVSGGNVELMGPSSGGLFNLSHAASMNATADDLVARGVLPGTSGGTGTAFAYAWHSWLETRLP